MLTLEKMREDYDWKAAFGFCSTPGHISPVVGSDAKRDFFGIGDVTQIVASSEGCNDGDNWVMVGKLSDGRYFFLDAWCDYTGWDCQSGGSVIVSLDLSDLWQFGLTDSARDRLGKEPPK